MTQSVYDAAGGYEGLLRLARAWHARAMADEAVAHAFSHGYRPDHSERLAAYWSEALGGPPLYTGQYGDESFVVREHSGNGEHDEMNERAIVTFGMAVADVGIDRDGALGKVLLDYWSWATWNPMYAYHRSVDDVPDGLSMPYWSWDGLVPTAE